MSEGLIGVIIGGLLSGVGTWITLWLQQRRWRTEIRVAHLKAKRDRMEETCERVLSQLNDAMVENAYPASMMSDIDFLLPDEVSNIFETMMADKDKDVTKGRHYYYEIARAMKKGIRDIEAEIDAVALGRKSSEQGYSADARASLG